VVERLLAVQAQDPRGMVLAVRARSRGLTAAAVHAELTERRSLVVTWLNRGTLHLVRREDLPWLHALTAPRMRTNVARRLGQEGVPPQDAERGVDAVVRALAAEGPLRRAELRERVRAAGVRTEGQALIQVLALASLRGLILRGPVVGAEQAFVLVRDWLGGPLKPVDRDAALAELARRYLAGHGPATDRDLARWAGLPLRDARAGLTAVASELVERPDGLVDLAGRPSPAPQPGPRLLGPFDPLLLGWSSREAVVPAAGRGVVTSNGIFRPVALVDGRAAGTWTRPRGRLVLAPFAPLSEAVEATLHEDARDVERFLGGI